MIRRLLLVLIIPLGLSLAGCPSFFGGTEGYDELDTALAPGDLARKDVFDAAASWTPVQIVLEQAVFNPDVPGDVKHAIKLVSGEMTAALISYRNAVEQQGSGGDLTAARLQTVLQIMVRAQTLMLQLYTDNLVTSDAVEQGWKAYIQIARILDKVEG